MCWGNLLAPDVLGPVQQQTRAGQPGWEASSITGVVTEGAPLRAAEEYPSGVPSTHTSPAGEDRWVGHEQTVESVGPE